MSGLYYVLVNAHWFALLIGALVFFHELGHFAVAKACGIVVHRFSLGFGPRILGFRYKETQYVLCLLPLGGYVAMLGEGGGDQADIDPVLQPRSFAHRPLWQRTLVVLAGPTANFALATALYFCMFCGTQTFGDTKLGIVTPGDPAWNAGLRPGDRVVEVFGAPIDRWDTLRDAIIAHPNGQLALTYERAGARHTATLKAQSRPEQNAFDQQEDRGKVGVSLMYVTPTVAVIDEASPAAQAGVHTGDTIAAVNGVPVAAWHEVRATIAAATVGKPLRLRLIRGFGAATLHPTDTGTSEDAPLPRGTTAITPISSAEVEITLLPTATTPPGLPHGLTSSADVPGGYTGLTAKNVMVTGVDADTPAAQIGLLPGDRVLGLALNSDAGGPRTRLIGAWEVDLATFGVDREAEMTLSWQHGREVRQRALHLLAQTRRDDLHNTQTTYVLGAHNDPDTIGTYTYRRRVGLLEAATESVKQVRTDMGLIARGISKMLRGTLPVSNMGGPIMLFVIAERSAKQGAQSFASTLAMVSTNLGMLNLLPVPVLDGGHLLFFALEAILRRPPSPRLRGVAQAVGMALVLLMMVLVFKNDLARFFLT